MLEDSCCEFTELLVAKVFVSNGGEMPFGDIWQGDAPKPVLGQCRYVDRDYVCAS